MTQIHKKFSVDQIKVLLSSYERGNISREEIENTLGVGKTRFFALLKEFRKEPDSFSIEYQRHTAGRLGSEGRKENPCRTTTR